MFVEIGVLAAGVIPGRLLRGMRRAPKVVGRLTMLTIYILLFVLGSRLGGDAALFDSLGLLGVQGCTIGFLCTMGSAVCVRLAQRFFREKSPAALRGAADGDKASSGKNNGKANVSGADEAAGLTGQAGRTKSAGNAGRSPSGRQMLNFLKGMSGSLIILACFFAGLALSRLGLLPPGLYSGNASLYLLWAMLFCVGMGVGFDLSSLLIVRDMGWRVALVPLLTLAGTAAGAIIAFLLLDMTLRSCLIVGAGLGYYSLASVVVTESAGAALGSIALLANVFRELFSLMATPFLARLLGPLAPGAAAGAPAMDTCLPVIMHFTGERYAIVALFNGLVMTMLVPVLLPLVMSL